MSSRDDLDPRDPRRQGVHQHGRGIARLAPRDIDTDPLHGRDLLPQQVARVVAVLPAVLHLVLVVGADACRGLLQRGALLVADSRQRIGKVSDLIFLSSDGYYLVYFIS